VPGSRYPVFVTVRQDSVFETAFFYPQQDGYYAENINGQKERETGQSEWAGLRYNIYPNPLTVPTLNVELYLPKQAQVNIRLLAQSGVILLDENKGLLPQGLHHLKINLPALNTGYCVVSVTLDKEYKISSVVLKK
jgi:hypothetical protein